MLDWLTRMFAPPMEPIASAREHEQAIRETERRIVKIEMERAARFDEYARKWPGAERPAGNLYRFSREFRG